MQDLSSLTRDGTSKTCPPHPHPTPAVQVQSLHLDGQGSPCKFFNDGEMLTIRFIMKKYIKLYIQYDLNHIKNL